MKDWNPRPTLTARELQVLELIARGHSAKESAMITGLSSRTIEHYVENIRLKLQAKNRAHIITRAICNGSLRIEGDNAVKIDPPDFMFNEEVAWPASTAANLESDSLIKKSHG